ncbi:MAG TPA: hypothetical protein VF478_13580 [Anaerolineae bacterium]
MLLRTRWFIVGFSLLVAACAVPLSPSLSPHLTPSATLAESTNAPTVATAPTIAAPAASSTAVVTATRSPTPHSVTATQTSIPRTPTLTLSKLSWQVRTLLVGPSRLYALLTTRFAPDVPEQMRFVISDDQGATWSPFPAGLPVDPACLHNVNLDYAEPDVLYASTCHGLERTTGNNWNLVSPQECWAIAVVYQQPRKLWAISTREKGGVIIKSDNAGAIWAPADAGLINFNGVANLAIDPHDANTLYAIINPRFAGSYLRRGNANGQWQTMHTPLHDNVIETGMTIDGAGGALYVTTADFSASSQGHWQVWRSLNPSATDINAVTWELVHDFGAGPRVVLLASGSGPRGLVLYAQFLPLDDDPYLQRSLDDGKTWARLDIR